MAWVHRIWNVLTPSRLSRDLEREIAFHIAERRDELIAGGMEPEAASREAARRFGNPLLQKERTRDVDVVVWLDSLVADVRHALRGLRRNPGFTAVAVLSLALGIGANTAIFSLANALLLKSLPVRDPAALVQVTMGTESGGYFTNPLWEAIRDRQKVFSGAFAFAGQRFTLTRGGPARRAPGALVSGGFFPTLGVTPAAGRLLAPSDDLRGCAPVAAVSEGFARREYGGAQTAVGRTLSLDGHSFAVVGVTDPAFSGIEVGSPVDVYVPLCSIAVLRDDPEVLDHRSMWYLQVVGRLADGTTRARAAAQLASVAPDVYRSTLPPKWGADDQKEYLASKLEVQPAARGLSELRDSYGKALMILMGIVALVLLVACANIANLLLARAASRQGESAIRQTLGAGRARLVRQLLTETVVLSLVGAAAGVVFASWASRLLVRFLSTGSRTVWLDLSLDLRVLGFTFLVALLTGLLFGLAPARHAARPRLHGVTRESGRGIVEGSARHRAGKALVLAQVAISLVLVVAAGLLVGSFRTLSTLDPGFRAQGVLVVRADFDGAGYDDAGLAIARGELLRRLRALPGVDAASASLLTPLGNMRWNELLVVPGYSPQNPRDAMAYFNAVSAGYFATMGTPLLAGRDLAEGDGAGAPRVAVVNQAFARKFLGPGSPLGKTFSTRVADGAGEPMQIVGVVGDAKYSSLDEEPPPTVYQPQGQVSEFGSTSSYELRSSGSLGALLGPVKDAVAQVSPAITIDTTTLADQLAVTLARPRLLATLSGFFGVLALLLAVIGLYGTLSYAVTRRRGEIGVRMALGAAGREVLRMVLAEAGLLVVAGLALGTALALVATRSLAAFLYGVEATDPTTLGIAAGILGITALGAGLIPAARAARTQPFAILRE
jgi:predicted permease